MTSNLTLTEFPPVSTEQWDEVVLKDSKGVAPKSRLFYRAADLQGLAYLDSTPGEFPYTRGTRGDNAWRIRMVAHDAAEARAAFEAGADEICLIVGDHPLQAILDGLPHCPVHFAAGARAAELLQALAAQKPTGSVDYEPLSDFARAAAFVRPFLNSQFRPITVQAHRFSESGASIIQELAFAIAEGVEIVSQLTDRGLTPGEAAQSMAFSFATGSEYFPEIAKLRAARTLWARAIAAFQPAAPAAARMTIYARTSHWTKTIYDPYVNALRATTEAMAAAIGGADSIQVEPFNEPYRTPDEAGIRLARNTQLILKQEAWLDRSVDPAAGSYYLEILTDSLARDAWSLFQQIEAAGGFLKYAESGTLRHDIATAAAKRRAPIVGTNQYPNLQEHMLPQIERQDPAPRAARAFEEIRLRTERYAARTGHTPRFLLLESGDLKMRKTRAGFATNFFGCAGFDIQVADTIASQPDVIVLCSSDAEYPALARRVFAELQAAGKTVPVIVAGNPVDAIDELKQIGVADFIHIRSNTAEVLRTWQERLGVRD